MKTNKPFFPVLLLAVALAASMPHSAHGQSPPNDNFTNRMVLAGTNLTFTGSVAQSSLESTAETKVFGTEITVYGSVWWTWTAPVSGVLNLQLMDYSREPDFTDAMVIYCATNPGSLPDASLGTPLGFLVPTARIKEQTLSVPIQAGLTYQFQLGGQRTYEYNAITYTFRLVTSDAPLILTPPASHTVFPQQSMVFWVDAVGVKPLAYQWQLAGTNLPGETAPMLSLTTISTAQAGQYTVVVSNSSGAVVSQPATLAVNSTSGPSSLTAQGLRSTAFNFSLNGEAGRYYRILTSSNLTTWEAEKNFAATPWNPNATSVIYNTNAISLLTITNSGGRKFLRAAPYVPVDAESEICINNLRQIRIAKELARRDQSAGITFFLPFDIVGYFRGRIIPNCPDDLARTFYSSYTMGNLQNDPVCLIHSYQHLLEEPR